LTEGTEGETVGIGEWEMDIVGTQNADSTHPVGYMIQHESGTVFHAGDSKPADSFSELGEAYDIDLGILAFGAIGNIPDKETREPVRTKWYATENETVKSASDLQLDRLLPSHWDMWRGLTADPTVLHHHAASFEHPRELEIVEIGDRVEL
jgi:L-ascorbate 6-phosphate lactonase